MEIKSFITAEACLLYFKYFLAMPKEYCKKKKIFYVLFLKAYCMRIWKESFQ